MRLSRWLALIAMLVGIGFLQVSQRNAIVLKAYAVGEGMHQVHAKETDVAWLNAEVAGLVSPAHLAQVARERRLKLVARTTLSTRPSASSSSRVTAGEGQAERQPFRLAAGDEAAD